MEDLGTQIVEYKVHNLKRYQSCQRLNVKKAVSSQGVSKASNGPPVKVCITLTAQENGRKIYKCVWFCSQLLPDLRKGFIMTAEDNLAVAPKS